MLASYLALSSFLLRIYQALNTDVLLTRPHNGQEIPESLLRPTQPHLQIICLWSHNNYNHYPHSPGEATGGPQGHRLGRASVSSQAWLPAQRSRQQGPHEGMVFIWRLFQRLPVSFRLHQRRAWLTPRQCWCPASGVLSLGASPQRSTRQPRTSTQAQASVRSSGETTVQVWSCCCHCVVLNSNTGH